MRILVPSFGRAGSASTMDILPCAEIVVPISQGGDYEKYYPGRVIQIDDKKDGNIAKKRNALLELFEEGEPFFMVDDDLLKVIKLKNGDMADVEQTMEIFYNLANEMGVWFGGFSIYSDPIKYAEYAPFSLNKPSYQCVFLRKDNSISYDEELGRHEDADIYLHYVKKHRMVLRDNRFFFKFECNKDVAKKKQKGGIEGNEDEYQEALDRIVGKWGSLVKIKNGKMNGVRNPIRGI